MKDGTTTISAGVTTGIDMMVDKVAETCGEIVACEVAHWLSQPVNHHET